MVLKEVKVLKGVKNPKQSLENKEPQGIKTSKNPKRNKLP